MLNKESFNINEKCMPTNDTYTSYIDSKLEVNEAYQISIIDPYHLWHSRLDHISSIKISYILKIKITRYVHLKNEFLEK